MSDAKKMDPTGAWLYMEKLLEEDEAKVARLEAMSDEEVREELRAGGIDPASVPTADEMIAYVNARAAARERDGQPAASGSATDDGARSGPARSMRAVAVPAARRHRPSYVGWLAAAAVVAIVFTFLAKSRDAIVAWWKHEDYPIGPDIPGPHKPTKLEQATALRDEAFKACDDEQWALCKSKLDEAQQLDPAGDWDFRVQHARDAAYIGMHPVDGGSGKKKKNTNGDQNP